MNVEIIEKGNRQKQILYQCFLNEYKITMYTMKPIIKASRMF
jgi:hypothetical protein